MSTPYAPGKGLNPFTVSIPPEVAPAPTIGGYGTPEGIVPSNPGTGYQDLDTNDFWVKFAGVQQVGWRMVGKMPVQLTNLTGGASVFMYSGNGSPVGVITPTASAAIYIQKDSDPAGILWSWYDSTWH